MSGSLTGTSNQSTATVNMTAVGTSDWIVWSSTAFVGTVRKASVTAQISDYTAIGTDHSYTGDARSLAWTDGTPTASSTGDSSGRYIGGGTGNGFSFTVPADTSVRTLSIYAGGYYSTGTLTATLSDGSAGPYTDTGPGNLTGSFDQNYVLTYNAASAGQTLTVTWLADVVSSGGGGGNVTLNGAALAVAPASFTLSASPSSLSIQQGDTGNSTITVNPLDGFTGTVAFTSSGLPAGTTLAFSPSSSTTGTTATFTVTSTTAGTYTVEIIGTSGALTAQTPIALTVTSAPAVVTGTASSKVTLTGSSAFQDIGTIGQTVAQLAGNMQSVNQILDVGLRNTRNYKDAFLRVSDLVGLGYATLNGNVLSSEDFGSSITVGTNTGIETLDFVGATVTVSGTTATITVSGGGGGTVNVTDSITGTGASSSPLALSGDAGSPGNSQYYGTNSSGTKGFFSLPSSGGSAAPSVYGIYSAPSQSGWTFISPNGLTTIGFDSDGALSFVKTASNTQWDAAIRTCPTGDFDVRALVTMDGGGVFAFFVRDSTTGNTYSFGGGSASQNPFYCLELSSPAGTYASFGYVSTPGSNSPSGYFSLNSGQMPAWFRLTRTSGVYAAYLSFNGEVWQEQVSGISGFVASPNQIAVAMVNNSNPSNVRVLAFTGA